MSAPPAPAGGHPDAEAVEVVGPAPGEGPDPEVVREARHVISSFLRRVEVYDVMPDSAKVRELGHVAGVGAPLARTSPHAARGDMAS